MRGTHYLEKKILDAFQDVTATAPTEVFIGLYFSDPTNTGVAGQEVSYVGYQRMPIIFTAPFIDEVGKVATKNTVRITFPVCSIDLGIVRYIGIHDSQTIGSGNMLLYGQPTIPLTVYADEQPSFDASRIKYYQEGKWSEYFQKKIFNFLRGENIGGFTPYLALYDGDPDVSGHELTGTTYARLECPIGNYTILSGGQSQMSNTETIQFEPPAIDENWGLYAYSVLLDALTGGNAIAKFPKDNPQNIIDQYISTVPEGRLKLTLD